jgi:pimeloyl-ACP methyl ester carboxylesterase
MAKMLILRGNRGSHPDEQGKTRNYAKGALHEQAAKEYARRKGYDGIVLDISGDRGSGKTRATSPQTVLALKEFHRDTDIAALYGFSGGGYNVYWILQDLKGSDEDLKRIKLVVVLGAPETPPSSYEASKYPPGAWDLVYRKDPPASAKFVPKGVKDAHMFGPEALLQETPDPYDPGY